jgi:hypothetical protein
VYLSSYFVYVVQAAGLLCGDVVVFFERGLASSAVFATFYDDTRVASVGLWLSGQTLNVVGLHDMMSFFAFIFKLETAGQANC